MHASHEVRPNRSIQNRLLLLYFCLTGLLTIRYGLSQAKHTSDWSVSDWLINYHGGFVRRGIVGEVALWMSSASHIPPNWLICVLQLCLYACIFLTAYRLLSRSLEHSPWIWAIILSPATFSFQVVDPSGGFRKEIMLIAGLCMLLLLLKRSVNRWLISGVLLILLPILVLAHESLFFYFGYYVVAILLADRRQFGTIRARKNVFLLGLPLLLSLIAMVAVSLHPGNPQIASTVCSAVKQEGIAKCGPAILYLSQTAMQAREDTLVERSQHNFPLIYAVTSFLAIFPIAVILNKAVLNQRTRYEAVTFCCAIFGVLLISIPLYVYAYDWGRWIYMNIICIALLLFFLDFDHADLSLPGRNILQLYGWPRFAVIASLAVYATCWTLPHVPKNARLFGYAERVISFRGGSRFR